ncbi:MAG TPA: class I SAM-dependent methyltransferase [Bacilli bacterium]
MRLASVIGFANKLVAERVKAGDCVVDATVGNGTDTIHLARLVGPRGIVFGFDIQQAAIDKTLRRFAAEPPGFGQLQLFCDSHGHMAARIPKPYHGRISAIMFNLGYLPGGDHSIVTAPRSTIEALAAALELLKPGGVITIVLYTGHPGGKEEAKAVEAWAEQLPQAIYQALLYRFINQKNAPPYCIAIEKIKASNLL